MDQKSTISQRPSEWVGEIPADFNPSQTVLRLSSYPRLYKAPEIRVYPQRRFASAFRGRPGLRTPLESYFPAMSFRCPRSKGCGVAIPATELRLPNLTFFVLTASRQRCS